MVSAADTDVFEAVRPRLFGIAYRMLGTRHEAEEIVQETWLRWQGTDRAAVREPAAFLATATTRLAINEAQSARARRETYIGPWLPEPVDTGADPLLGAVTGEALELGVLMLLEKLTPTERATYVLREAFDYSYADIAEALEFSEANARQLSSRARKKLDGGRRAKADADAHRRLLDAIVAAAQAGDVKALEQMLAQDVVTYADGGGVVNAARKPILGRERVAKAPVGSPPSSGRGSRSSRSTPTGSRRCSRTRRASRSWWRRSRPPRPVSSRIFFVANPEKMVVTP